MIAGKEPTDMSAWIVDRNHINVMVDFAVTHDLLDDYDRDDFGQMLWDWNYWSINYRYGGKHEAPTFTSSKPEQIPTLPEMFAIVSCYDYQACERPDYEKSDARAFVYLAKIVTGEHSLSGLPWGWVAA